MNPERILVIQTAFIGDLILTTPLIEGARIIFPRAQIDILVVPNTKNVLENNPNINKIISYDKRGKNKGLYQFLRLGNSLKKNRYDLVLLPHRSLRSALLAKLTGAKTRIGFSKGYPLFYSDTVTYNPNIHEVDRNLGLLSPCGGNVSGIVPSVYPGDQDYSETESRFHISSITKPIVALAPGSVWATKKWPEASYIQLAKGLSEQGMSVVLIGGAGDRELCERIKKAAGEMPVNTAGELTLLQSAALLKQCSALVCNDSGSLHLGVAIKTKVIAIFGPTVPAFGFYPYGDGHTVIEKKLDCRPCAIHGGKKCPIDTHACMRDIHPDLVLESVLQVMKR